jgi:6-phosphogluconolactonase
MRMTRPNPHVQELAFFAFADREAAYAATSDALAASIAAAHGQGRRARLALSGGTTPAPAYRALAATQQDWAQVDVALVDERWVDIHDSGSNAALVVQAFEAAQGVGFHPMKTDHARAVDGAVALEPIYQSLRPFDAVVLGMGPDAHTASWFAGAPQLAQCLDPKGVQTVCALDAAKAPVAGQYPWRISLTLPPIAEAEQVILLIFGDEKKRVLEQALTQPILQAPIRAALESCADRLVVFWAN